MSGQKPVLHFSMSTITLTADKFEDTISQDGMVLLDFWAEWCGPCKSFGPVFEEASEKHPEATFAKINTEVEQELSAALNIRSIPTLMAFRDGILVFSQPGALPQSALEDLITQVEALDMDEVRAQVESQKSEAEQATEDKANG